MNKIHQAAWQSEWTSVTSVLTERIGEDAFSNWFGSVQLQEIRKGIVTLSVPTNFLRSWITTHYGELLLELWQEERKTVTRITLVVRGVTRTHPKNSPPQEEVIPETGMEKSEGIPDQEVVSGGSLTRRRRAELIQEVTARYYHINKAAILSQSRKRHVTEARMVAMYLTQCLMPYCSRTFMSTLFCRNHATVHSNLRKISVRMETQPALANTVAAIRKQLETS